MTNNLTRRNFLKSAAIGAAALSLDACTRMNVRGANDDIRVAVIGFNGRGAGHIRTLQGMKGVRVVALCDVDSKVLDKGVKTVGGNVMACADMRKIFDNPEIDAVSIATPNHWHALATIWACQAGKDVYVEKPVSHNLFEGVKMVEAARKYDRIVQAGTQCRSSQGLRDAVDYVRKGELGKIVVARGFCYKARKSIGLCGGPQQVPGNIDYNLWSGPAPLEPPRRNGSKGPVHYDWHWFWNYGNGDFGNQAPHQVDICRWFLGEQSLAPFVMCAGGRLGYKDDAETPNTMITYMGYEKAPMIFEVRGLPTDKASQTAGWKMDNYKGAGIGCVIECENGYVVVPSYTRAIIFDKDGNKVREFTGKDDVPETASPDIAETTGGHHGNWIAAVRSRKVERLTADVLEGHLSAGLVHTCNAAYRIGAPKSPEAIKAALNHAPGMAEAFDRMASHLEKNGVDITKDQVTLGAPLTVDVEQANITRKPLSMAVSFLKKDGFVDNEAANAFLTRNYRKPFVVPERV